MIISLRRGRRALCSFFALIMLVLAGQASFTHADELKDHLAQLDASYCFQHVTAEDLLDNMTYCLYWPTGLELGTTWTREDQCREAQNDAIDAAACMNSALSQRDR